MSNTDFIVHAWHIDNSGTDKKIDTAKPLPTENYWIHCDRSSSDFEQWLTNEGIDASIVASLLASDTRPRFQQLDDNSFFLILRGVNLNEGKAPDDMLTIRILYTPSRLITCNAQKSRAIQSVVDALAQGKGPQSIELLVIALISQLSEKIESVIEPIEQFIDSQDHDEFSTSEIADINAQHRKLLRLNRFLKPQSFALTALSKNKIKHYGDHQVSLANLVDTMQRIVDTIDFYIAQVDVINNRIEQLNSEIMNRNTYLLSIIAGIFLPLGFLTGLFGINIGGMPGVENNDAFYWFCGILTGIGVFELYVFRRLKFL